MSSARLRGKVYVRALATRVAAEARTNDLGEYRLFGLEPGTYVISAERYQGPSIQGARLNTPTPPCPDCRGEGTMSMPLPACCRPAPSSILARSPARSTLRSSSPARTDRSAASPVKVTPGARVEGIDLSLVVR